ncbi:MAG: hypothetical protein KAU24_01870, partial [Candidatus Aenigmarchaeota archaeon]|nr:hypothetical protein [Candidatus Aenigmarchaeota archaeon]
MKAKENEGKKLFIIFILLVVTYSIGIIGMVSATPADPGHGAPAIGPGTFEGGFYVFPNNLSVTQNFSLDTNTLYVDSVLHRIGIGTTSPGYLLEIHNASNALNVSDILFVSGQTGRVGIGTAGPDVLLHLIDTVAATPTILFEGGSNDIGWDSAQNLQFSTWDGTTAFVKMTIRSDGKVGIGIVNPEDKLSVSGTINGTDIVCDGGGCINAVELNSDVAGLGLNTTSGVLAVNI